MIRKIQFLQSLYLLVLALLVVVSPARASALALSPAPTRAFTGGAIAFVASNGSGGYAFTLTSAPSGGTITSAGAYKAGLVGGVTDVVQVTDSSGATASTNVDVLSSLTISGASSSIPIDTTVTLIAAGGSGGGYVWSLTSLSGGTLTSAGVYTSGIHGDVTDDIVLTDGAGNQTTLALRVTSGLAIAPASPRVTCGAKVGFVASGGSGAAYVFTLTRNESGATLNAFGIYVAGPVAGVTDAVELRDAFGNTITATITVESIAISPTNPTVIPGAERAFIASGGSGHGYVWTLESAPSGGTINDFGIYRAGNIGGMTDVLRVVDSTGNVSTTRITVEGPRISPSTASVASGAALGFVAAGGTVGYTWSLATNASGGSVNAFGVYTAGPLPGVSDVIQVVDARGGRATATITVTGGPTITPLAPSISVNTRLGFVASGGSGGGYTWSLVRAASGGTIDDFGVYTAGSAAGTDEIAVTDGAGSRSTTNISVVSGLTISPSAPVVYQGTKMGFVARGGTGEGYTWTIGTNGSGGEVTKLGAYTAGTPEASANVTDTVRVTDSAGNSASVSITVLPPPPNIEEADGGLVSGSAGEDSDDSGCDVPPSQRSDPWQGLVIVAIGLFVRRRRR
jgi:hypothetical protein